MNSTRSREREDDYQARQEETLEQLEELRPVLEALAESDLQIADRAQLALNRLNRHETGGRT